MHELVRQERLLAFSEDIADYILCYIYNVKTVDVLVSIGVVPSTVLSYESAITWGAHLSNAEALGDALLNGPDFKSSSQKSLTAALEALNYKPAEMHIGTVYTSGTHRNVCSVIYKLNAAHLGTAKVTAGMALLRSLWIFCIRLGPAFEQAAAKLAWKHVTEKELALCLGRSMNRGHNVWAKRTMLGVRHAANFKGYSVESIVRAAFQLSSKDVSAVNAAGGMLYYVPESSISWFPGASSLTFDMFKGKTKGYKNKSAEQVLKALQAGALPPYSCFTDNKLILNMFKPMSQRAKHRRFFPKHLRKTVTTIFLCLRNARYENAALQKLPLEASTMVVDITLATRKL